MRFLVLDWNRDNCRILAANVAKSGVQIERALVWPQREFFPAGEAEDVGKKLRDFLKNAGMAGAPVLVCLPRQRVLLKEIRCPVVPAAEEAAIVRFQAAKDLLETPDDVVIDYAIASRTATENQVLVAALRKDVLAAYQNMCKSAGLKLAAVTPRPFVLANCLARARKIGQSDEKPLGAPEWSAVLQLGEGWGELTMLHGNTVVFTRSLSGDSAVDAEVRRSLVAFTSQPLAQAPAVLYIFGDDVAAEAERLTKLLNIPVVAPRYLTDADAVAKDISCPAGVGMLSAWADERLPVNFITPKEPRPAAPPNTRRLLLAAAGSFVALLLLFVVCNEVLKAKQADIQKFANLKKQEEDKLESPANKQDRADLDALKKWNQGSISWIDELYDISARFPRQEGFFLTRLHGDVLAHTSDKDRFGAKIGLTGTEPPGRDKLREDFLKAMDDHHLHAHQGPTTGPKFTVDIDVAHQPATSYTTKLPK